MSQDKRNIWNDIKKPIVYLAPMSGITNKPYRQMVKKFASDIVFPEFVSIHALHHNKDKESKTLQMLKYDEWERPIIAQLFGSTPEYFHEAALICKELGFDGVDINFGCPAPKVAKKGGGCALLGDFKKGRAVIQAVLDAVGDELPVSVKTRVSYKKVHVRDFCKEIADMPLANLCIHGRSFEKPYEGKSDLECIKEAKQLVPFLVTASGHGHTPEAAKETLDYTGADGITIARGSFGNPWLIKQIKEYLETGSYWEPTQAEKLDIMLEHAKLATEYYEDNAKEASTEELAKKRRGAFIEMRKVLAWYVKGIPHARKYRAQLVRVQSVADVETVVEQIKSDFHGLTEESSTAA